MEVLLFVMVGLWTVLYVGAGIAVIRRDGWEAKLVGVLLLSIGLSVPLGLLWLLTASWPITG